MKRLLLLIALFALLHPPAAAAADQTAVRAKTAEKAADPALAPATLKIQNRPIITLRGTLLGYSPKQRIMAAEARINTAIERRHAFWELRFRHTDAAFAQALVNMWAQRGYQSMLQMQADGLAPAYVVYGPPTLARKPLQPVYYATNKLVLAGSLVGWLAGLLFVELAARRMLARTKS